MRKFKYLFLLVPLVLLILFYFRDNIGHKGQCDDLKKFCEEEYRGVVFDKYLNKNNHNFETIIIDCQGEKRTIILPRDTSGFYNFISIKDSIVKNKLDCFTKVYKQNSEIRFYISWGCE